MPDYSREHRYYNRQIRLPSGQLVYPSEVLSPRELELLSCRGEKWVVEAVQKKVLYQMRCSGGVFMATRVEKGPPRQFQLPHEI